MQLNGHADAWQVVEDERAYRISGVASALLISLVTNRTMHPYCGVGVLEHGGGFASILRDPETDALKLFDPIWSKSNSPWAAPHDCVWPVVPTDMRLCNDGSSFMSTWGQPTYQCFRAPASDAIAPGAVSHCGSNFDFRGNSRFIDSDVMRSPTWGSDWMWGYRTFDSMFESMLSIFQCITTENWAHIMYMFSDSSGAVVTPMIFCLLLLFGAYFVLNLILAVLGDNFDEMMIRELEVIELANARRKILVEVLRVRRRLHIMAKKQKAKRKMRLARQFHADKHQLDSLHSYNSRHSIDSGSAQVARVQVANPMVNPFDAEVDLYPEASGHPDAEGGSSSGEEDGAALPALASRSEGASAATAGAALSSADEVAEFLRAINMERYIDTLVANGYDELDVLAEEAPATLSTIGVMEADALYLVQHALLQTFGNADTDGSGGIDPSELLAILPPGTSLEAAEAVIQRYGCDGDGELQNPEFKQFALKELHGMWDEHANLAASAASLANASSDEHEHSLTPASVDDSRDHMVHASLEMSDTSLEDLLDANEISGDALERLAQLDEAAVENERALIESESRKRQREMMDLRDEIIFSLAQNDTGKAHLRLDLRLRIICEANIGKFWKWWSQGDPENPPPWRCWSPHSDYWCYAKHRAELAASEASEEDADGALDGADAMGGADADVVDEDDEEIDFEAANIQLHGTCKQPCQCAVAMHWIATSPVLDFVVTLCILINTATLAMDHYPIETSLSVTLEIVNFVLTVIFFLEMCVKLPGIGIRMYVRNAFNFFDGFIVIVSIFEIVLSPPAFLGGSGSSGGAISALRTFRVFRLLKLARRWRRLQSLLRTVVAALKSGVYFILLMCLFVFIYTLVGMQLFANKFHFDAWSHDAVAFKDIVTATNVSLPHGYYRPRSHFDTFTRSIFTIFQVLTTEDWDVVMFDARRAAGRPCVCVRARRGSCRSPNYAHAHAQMRARTYASCLHTLFFLRLALRLTQRGDVVLSLANGCWHVCAA